MSGEFRQDDKDVIDVLLRVTCGDLESDLFIALGHHRKVEAGCQDVMCKEVVNQVRSFLGLSDH